MRFDEIPVGASLSGKDLDTIRRDLAFKGWSCLCGVEPTDETLMAFVAALGSTDLGADEHLTGPAIMDLKFDRERARLATASAYFTADEFNLHTDLSYIDLPPRYMLTHCVQPDGGGGGATLVADIRDGLDLLSATDQQILREPVFSFRYPPGCDEGVSPTYAVLEDKGESTAPRLRFRRDRTVCPPSHEPALARLADALFRSAFQLQLQAADLLIIDNTRMAHGRTALSETGAAHRHLRRAYAAGSPSPSDPRP